ncbi:MAG: hypothetical protein ACRD0N_12995 [Acidimicrobiales bacterium]
MDEPVEDAALAEPDLATATAGELEEEPPAPAPPAPPPATAEDGGGEDGEPRRSPWTALALIALVVVLGLGAILLLGDGGDDQQASTTTTTAASTTRTTAATASEDCPTPNDDYQAVSDAPAGFTLEYPASWQPIREASGEERLLLSAGGECYFQVTVRRAAPATAQAEIQQALSGLELLTEPQSVTLNGLPATLYLYYTPKTEDSPVEGVHVHYFLLNGDQLYSMVFQALPTSELLDLVPAFDRVAKSFTLQAQTPAPGGTTTTGG